MSSGKQFLDREGEEMAGEREWREKEKEMDAKQRELPQAPLTEELKREKVKVLGRPVQKARLDAWSSWIGGAMGGGGAYLTLDSFSPDDMKFWVGLGLSALTWLLGYLNHK